MQGTVTLRINCSRTGHAASECMATESVKTEDQVRAACYAPKTIAAELIDSDDQIRLISIAEAEGPSRPVVVTCNEKEILTTLGASALNCTETIIPIHLVLSIEQKRRPNLPLHQLKEGLYRNTVLK